MFNFISFILSHKAKDVSVTDIYSFFFFAAGLPRRMTQNLFKRILSVMSGNPHHNSSVQIYL